MPSSMLTPEQQIRQRSAWFQEAARLGNVALACKRCGISRKTFYKWRTRFRVERDPKRALRARSRRPHRPHQRVTKSLRRRLRQLRQQTHLGPARLQALLRARGLRPVPRATTIAKLLRRAGLTRRQRVKPTRYRRVFIVPRAVHSVAFDSDGVIRIVLSGPRLEEKALIFSPDVRDGRVEWRCSGPGIPGALLPVRSAIPLRMPDPLTGCASFGGSVRSAALPRLRVRTPIQRVPYLELGFILCPEAAFLLDTIKARC